MGHAFPDPAAATGWQPLCWLFHFDRAISVKSVSSDTIAFHIFAKLLSDKPSHVAAGGAGWPIRGRVCGRGDRVGPR